MTTLEAPVDAGAVFQRLADIDDETLAVVTAAFGRTPSVSELDPAELARLSSVIDAVTSGRAQAAEAMAVARAELDATPVLPDLPPPDVSALRQRIRDLDDTSRGTFLARWQQSGLTTVLADPAGQSVILDKDVHNAIERLLAEHEPEAPDDVKAEVHARLASLPGGARAVVDARMHAQGIADVRMSYGFTIGRAWLLTSIIETVEAEAVAGPGVEVLGPVADPPGQIVTAPVVDAADLADQPPAKAKIPELLAWVGDDPARAAKALTQEAARKSPRKGVLDKLVPIADRPAIGTSDDRSGVGQAHGSPSPTPEPPSAVAADPAPSTDGEPSDDGAPPPAAVTATLESPLFREVPVSDWSPLHRGAYLRRLAAELDVAGQILEQAATAVLAERGAP